MDNIFELQRDAIYNIDYSKGVHNVLTRYVGNNGTYIGDICDKIKISPYDIYDLRFYLEEFSRSENVPVCRRISPDGKILFLVGKEYLANEVRLYFDDDIVSFCLIGDQHHGCDLYSEDHDNAASMYCLQKCNSKIIMSLGDALNGTDEGKDYSQHLGPDGQFTDFVLNNPYHYLTTFMVRGNHDKQFDSGDITFSNGLSFTTNVNYFRPDIYCFNGDKGFIYINDYLFVLTHDGKTYNAPEGTAAVFSAHYHAFDTYVDKSDVPHFVTSSLSDFAQLNNKLPGFYRVDLHFKNKNLEDIILTPVVFNDKIGYLEGLSEVIPVRNLTRSPKKFERQKILC